MSLPTPLNAPVQAAAQAIAALQSARHTIMGMGGSPRNPLTKQAILLSHMLGRANDAISDEFTRIVGGEPIRFEVVLRDKVTGALHDVHTRAAL